MNSVEQQSTDVQPCLGLFQAAGRCTESESLEGSEGQRDGRTVQL